MKNPGNGPPTLRDEIEPGKDNGPEKEQVMHRQAVVRQAELVISYVLRGGVLLSAAIILSGVALFYFRAFASGGYMTAASAFPHTLAGVEQGIALGNPLAIIVLGLLVLLATPVVRVAVSIVAFLLERDWRYVVITSMVLLILLLSFVLGKGGA
ncbi:MAG TPA: DUF1634 domain-containing protein [Ktedonobacterales bacterium]|nr:DUF1634 domain-containing protein [Ktedonobacterales bacterium]